MDSPFSKENRTTTAAVFLFLLVVVFLCYESAFSSEFIDYDDPAYVTENNYVKSGLTWVNIKWALSPTFLKSHFYSYHPLTWLSHQADVSCFGMNAAFHHGISVALHFVNSCLFYIFLFLLTKDYRAAFAGTVLFAIHPVRVEPVLWVSSRKDLLSTFFWILAVNYYFWRLKSSGKFHGKASRVNEGTAFLFLLGLLCKSMVMTLPLILLLVDRFILQSIETSADFWRAVKAKALSMGIMFIFVPLAWWGQSSGGSLNAAGVVHLSERLLNMVNSYTMYFVGFFCPGKSAILYPYGVDTISGGTAFFAVTFFFLVSIGLLKSKNLSGVCFGWFWFLVTALPVSGFFHLGVQAWADRFAYLPSMGLATSCSCLIAYFLSSKERYGKGLFFIVTLVVFPLFIVSTREQASFWRNSESIFTRTLNVTRENYVIHNNLAVVLRKQGQFSKALSHIVTALSIKPGFTECLTNLGTLVESFDVLSRKDVLLIENLYAQSFHFVKKDPLFLFNLAFFRERTGNYEEAVKMYRASISLAKGCFPRASNNMGNILKRAGYAAEAEQCFVDALKCDDSFQTARFNLALLYHQQGKFSKALNLYETVIDAQPQNVNALGNGGAAAVSLKKYGLARKLYEKALRIDPQNEVVQSNLDDVKRLIGASAQ